MNMRMLSRLLFLPATLWTLTNVAWAQTPAPSTQPASRTATPATTPATTPAAKPDDRTKAAAAPTTKPAASTTKPAARPAAKKPEKPKDGWFPKLSLGVNIALSSSDNVPGVDNGITFSLGGVLNGGLLMRFGRHKWESSLKIVHTQTKTPQLEPFIKTADNFDFKSAYSYQFVDSIKFGVRAGVSVTTQLFPGYFIPATAVDVTLLNVDTTQVQRSLQKEEAFQLTLPFSPLTFGQSVGFVAEPYRNKYTELDIELNVSAEQTWAAGYVLQDDATTPRLEFKQLRDYTQIGGELKISFEGKIDKFLNYSFYTKLMMPFFTSVPTELQGFELLNADVQFKVSLTLSKWAALNYVFRAQRTPLLTEKWQVSNNLVLSFTADIF